MENYGIKVAEPDFDVRTAEDKNLSLKSGLTLLKVAKQGTIDLDADWVTVAHNLGYVPQFLVFLKDTSATPDKISLGTADLNNGLARADTSNLYIGRMSVNRTTAFYYIFYEPAQSGTAPSYTPTNSFGLKVSKNDVDVNEANVLQQTFNSELNSLKIIVEDTVTSTASGVRTVNIAHGLTVVPGYFVFFEVDNDGLWYPNFTSPDGVITVEAYTDEDNLIITISTSGSKTVKVKYYILADPGL
jgi:hypothetical protein